MSKEHIIINSEYGTLRFKDEALFDKYKEEEYALFKKYFELTESFKGQSDDLPKFD